MQKKIFCEPFDTIIRSGYPMGRRPLLRSMPCMTKLQFTASSSTRNQQHNRGLALSNNGYVNRSHVFHPHSSRQEHIGCDGLYATLTGLAARQDADAGALPFRRNEPYLNRNEPYLSRNESQ